VVREHVKGQGRDIVNRQELTRKIMAVADSLLNEKGHVCVVDVLIRMDWLSASDLEAWQFRRVPYLERVVRCNIPRLDFALSEMRRHLRSRGLRPSITAYMSWGSGHRTRLQFSRSAEPVIEEGYSTHWLPPKADGPRTGPETRVADSACQRG